MKKKTALLRLNDLSRHNYRGKRLVVKIECKLILIRDIKHVQGIHHEKSKKKQKG